MTVKVQTHFSSPPPLTACTSCAVHSVCRLNFQLLCRQKFQLLYLWMHASQCSCRTAGPDRPHGGLLQQGRDGWRGLPQARRCDDAAAGGRILLEFHALSKCTLMYRPLPSSPAFCMLLTPTACLLMMILVRHTPRHKVQQQRYLSASLPAPQVSLLPLGHNGPSLLCVTPDSIAQVTTLVRQRILLPQCLPLQAKAPRCNAHAGAAAGSGRLAQPKPSSPCHQASLK